MFNNSLDSVLFLLAIALIIGIRVDGLNCIFFISMSVCVCVIMLVVVIVFPLSCFYSVSNGCYKSDYIHHFRWPLIVNASITWCNMLKIFNVFSRNKQKKKALKSFNLQSVGVFFPWIFHAFEMVYCKFIRTRYWNGQRATNALKKFIDRSKCGMNAFYAWLPRFHLVASFAIFWLYYGINSLPINDLHLHITRNRMESILNDFLSIMIFFMHIFLWFFFLPKWPFEWRYQQNQCWIIEWIWSFI